MTLRIGIATDDGKTVKEGYFTESKFFSIYDLTGKTPAYIELRPNSHRTKKGDPLQVLRGLRDCDVIIGKKFSANSRKDMEAMGVIAHETKREEVDGSVLGFSEDLARLGVRS